MKEDQIAALDGDWSEFTPAERAAFAFGRKFTFEPHKLTAEDIDALRKYYKDLQILEMVLSMAGNNAINRWKEGAGVPQNASGGGLGRGKGEGAVKESATRHTYVTPTSEAYKTRVTKVAPLAPDAAAGSVCKTVSLRPPLESRAEVEKMLAAARTRMPRLPLVDEAKARELLPADWPAGPLPQWVRFLANFPGSGKGRILSQWSAEEGKWDLPPLLRAQVAWIVARQDRAWYAAGRTQGVVDVARPDGGPDLPTRRRLGGVRAGRAGAIHGRPQVGGLADRPDGRRRGRGVKLAGPKEVVQAISYTTTCASFDRITESAGLQLEK